MQSEYFTVAHVLHVYGDEIYQITDKQFIRGCMELSHGFMNPKRAEQIYDMLMADAGLLPLRASQVDEQLAEFHRELNMSAAANAFDKVMRDE
jgi:hypothetical protein